MKLLKYRSVFALATAIGLSVFLFTACEKESDTSPAPKPDRLEKFKRLRFSGESTSTSSSSGSGTFIGNGSNISYVPAGGSETNFVSASSSNQVFTDPMSTGSSFTVYQSFGAGGGSLTLDGTNYDFSFGLCAESDIFGQIIEESEESETSDELNVFIGVAGDFDISSSGSGQGSPGEMGADLFFYALSFGGSTSVGDYIDFSEGDRDGGAFVFALKFEEDEMGEPSATTYFATEGSVNFSGSEVVLAGMKMAKVEDGELSSELVDLQAQLECVQASNILGEEE